MQVAYNMGAESVSQHPLYIESMMYIHYYYIYIYIWYCFRYLGHFKFYCVTVFFFHVKWIIRAQKYKLYTCKCDTNCTYFPVIYGLNSLFVTELQEKWPMSKKDMNMNSALLQLIKQDLVNQVIPLSQLLQNLAFVSIVKVHDFILLYHGF
jgi:hypothetical protein